MTRTWNNDSAHSGLTENTRSALRALEGELALSTGARHVGYTVGFADIGANGLASLFTLGATEAIVEYWAVVTAAFDGSPSPNTCYVCATAFPTSGDRLGSLVFSCAAPSLTAAGGTVWDVSSPLNLVAVSPVSAAVPLSVRFANTAADDPVVGATTGSVTVHFMIASLV